MQCQVTGCGNSADKQVSISMGSKWGPNAYKPANAKTRTVTLCQLHIDLLDSGKLRPQL